MAPFAHLDPRSTVAPRWGCPMWLCVAALICFAPLAHRASATPSDADLLRAEAMATEAKAYFKGKLYQQAADKFMESFAVAGRPALVFNAARAYEEAKMPKRAIAIFQMYVTLDDVPPEGRADARARIEKLKTEVALREKAARDERKRRAAARARKARRHATPEPKRKKAPPTARASFPVWRTAGGGALVMLGLISLGVSYSVAARIPSENVTTRELMAEYLDNAASARAWYGVFVGATAIGFGLIAWGQYDYWLPPPTTRGRVFSALHITPILTGQGPGMNVSLRF